MLLLVEINELIWYQQLLNLPNARGTPVQEKVY